MIAPARTPIALAAARVGCSEGQLYTMLIGLGLALLLAVPGIPAVLRDRPAAARADVALRPFGENAGAAAAAEPAAAPAAAAPATAESIGAATGSGAQSSFAPSAGRSAPVAVASPGSAAATATPEATAPASTPAAVGPLARIADPGAPGGLAVAADGTIVVTTDNGTARGRPGPSHVFSYAADGKPVGDRAVAGQRSDRAGGLTGVAVDPRGAGVVAVLDPDGARILRIDMTSGKQSVIAKIPDLPACLVSLGAALCQPGVEDRKPFPMSAVYDRQANLFFTDPAQDTIWRLRPTATTPEVWYQSPYFATGAGPDGIAIHDGSVVITVGSTVDVSAFDAGALYRIPVKADGSAGDLTLVHGFAQGDQPGPLAVGERGTAYVALRDSGAIVAIEPDGSQSRRIDPPGSGAVPLDAPGALALAPRTLLVANGRTSRDPGHWAVLAIPLEP